jgi:hypothetical protein
MKKTLKTVGIKVLEWIKRNPLQALFIVMFIAFVFYLRANMIIVK